MADRGDIQEPKKSDVLGNCGENNKAYINKICAKYAPYVAVVSSGIFNTNLMSPLVLERPLGSRSVLAQNVCFALAHIGTGLCIYDKTPRKMRASCNMMMLASITGSVVFNYGTLLILANIKHYMPESQLLRIAVGVGVVGYLFAIGNEYLNGISELGQEVN